MSSESIPVPDKPQRTCRRAFLALLGFTILMGLFAVTGAGIGGWVVYQHIVGPGVPGEPVRLIIPDKSTGTNIARQLTAYGLIEHELLFRAALKLDKTRKPLKSGPYALPKGLAPMELLRILQDGPNRPLDPWDIPPDRRVTVPEGLTLEQMAKLFAAPEQFLAAAADPKLIETLGIDTKTLEGFLWPSTYFFDKKPTEREVVERMLKEFRDKWGQLVQECPEAKDRNLLETVTIASLIEEEAKNDEERPLISAVIHNRIKKKMPLQLDATVQYALKKYGERILYSDLETDSPYNTYKNPGLPPGPISSPGLASLRAAVRPADADYLFYVSNADGQTHTFSATEAEHVKATKHFRKEIREQRREEKKSEKR